MILSNFRKAKKQNKLLTQPLLISKTLVSTFYYCHSFRSSKVQSWKAVYISRRCQIAEKDNNCVNFWCRKSPWKLNHVPTSNFSSWFTSFSRVLPTSRVGYHAGKPIESVVYCLSELNDSSLVKCYWLLPGCAKLLHKIQLKLTFIYYYAYI